MADFELQQLEIRPAHVSVAEVESARSVVLRSIPDRDVAAEVVAMLGLDVPDVPLLPVVVPSRLHGTVQGFLRYGCRCCICVDRMVRLGLIAGES